MRERKAPFYLSLYGMIAQKSGGHFALLLLTGKFLILRELIHLLMFWKLFDLLFEFFDFQFASLQMGEQKRKPLLFVF